MPATKKTATTTKTKTAPAAAKRKTAASGTNRTAATTVNRPATPSVAKPAATKPETPKPETSKPLTVEDAMQAIGEFAAAKGTGWREELRTLWSGKDDGSRLHAARTLVPVAMLGNLTFKAERKLTPEEETSRRLRAVGTELHRKAKAIQSRAKEVHDLARQLRQKGKPKAVAAVMRQMHEEGQLAAIEAEVST